MSATMGIFTRFFGKSLLHTEVTPCSSSGQSETQPKGRFQGSVVMNFSGYTEPEIQRWLWLRAIEWSGFPAYVSQIVGPILFIFYPWWQVVLGFILVGFIWCIVRYWFVSVTISTTACLAVVWLKWPIAICSAIYLFIQQQFVAGVVAIVWPFVAGFTTPPGKVGVIELRLAKRIGYVAPDAEI
jgi:hypothetical protein